ncbi:NYN domain-containing protein [bacterium]|nr:NYN domain-containing protein [candidate division CSSED10-310 bacterium]
MAGTIETNKVAIYWDFENIHWSIQAKQPEMHEDYTGKRRYKMYQERHTRENERRVDIKAIIDYVSSFGSIVVNRAYANWTYFISYRYVTMENAIDLVQLFHRGPNAKNGADIRIAVDALEDIYQHSAITHVVVVGGDSDFTGVAQKLREHNKYVIGIGAKSSSNSYWIKSCNEFKFYHNILLQIGEATEADKEEAVTTGDVINARELLVKALKRLIPGGMEESALKAAIKPMMLRLDPSFDETDVGFTSFSGFLESCQDLIQIEQGEHDHLVRLREAGQGKVESEDGRQADPVNAIQQTLRQINYRLLPAPIRVKGLEAVFDIFQKTPVLDGFRALEEKIIEYFEQGGQALLETDAKKLREMVYKARGFRFQPPEGTLTLVEEITSAEDLLNRIDRSILQRIKDKCPTDVRAEDLADLLYPGDARRIEYIRQLMKNNSF